MKQILVDGNNMAFRSHYSHIRLSAHGMPTGVIFGSLQAVRRLKEKFSPCRIIVCWDTRKNIRKEIVPSYKASRELTRDKKLAVSQIPKLTTMLRSLGVPSVAYTGLEADDLIAILSKNKESIIVSNDKDLYQLLCSTVSILKPHDETLYTIDAFIKEFGIKPNKWVDVLALAGKGSNDMVGVKGVGIKTAVKFIKGERIADKCLDAIEAAINNTNLIQDNTMLAELPLIDITPKIPRCTPDIATFKAACISLKFTSILKQMSLFEDLFFC